MNRTLGGHKFNDLYCTVQPAPISTKFTETLKHSFIYSQVCVSVCYMLDGFKLWQ